MRAGGYPPEPSWIGGPDYDFREPWEYQSRCPHGHWLPMKPERVEPFEDGFQCDGKVHWDTSGEEYSEPWTQCFEREAQHEPHFVIQAAGVVNHWSCPCGEAVAIPDL